MMPDEEKRRRAHFLVDSSRSYDSARTRVHETLAESKADGNGA
jgi:hypothetical protein